MRRIFHPVGQGAFFSEHFEETQPPFTVVYDCGSSSLTDKQRKTKINSSFKERHVIDMLFISHFHADHINGIAHLKQQCQIKNVVIPYLDDEAKALIKVANYLEYKFTETEIIDNPVNYFGGDARIITVLPVGENGLAEGVNIDDAFQIDTGDDTAPGTAITDRPGNDTTEYIESGRPISSRRVPAWLFIPFNYNMTARAYLFLAKLEERGLCVADINAIEKIEKHKAALREAYDFVAGDLNKNSLLLYSGPILLDKKVVVASWAYDFPSLFQRSADHKLGCLYTGDADLNEPMLISSLFRSLGRFWNLIGILTAAHHGAIKNHNAEITALLPELKWNVFSYGTANTYGHPSDEVISDMLHVTNHIVRVTEEVNSLAVFKTFEV